MSVETRSQESYNLPFLFQFCLEVAETFSDKKPLLSSHHLAQIDGYELNTSSSAVSRMNRMGFFFTATILRLHLSPQLIKTK